MINLYVVMARHHRVEVQIFQVPRMGRHFAIQVVTMTVDCRGHTLQTWMTVDPGLHIAVDVYADFWSKFAY